MAIRKFLQSLLHASNKRKTSEITNAPVGLSELIVPPTAQQLERPCLFLKRTGVDLAAVWGGAGIVAPPSGPYRHWISVGSQYLPAEFGTTGVLSVYTNDEDCTSGIALFSLDATLAEGSGEYLYAHTARSLPPPDASPDLDNKAYTKQWMNNCPIYNGNDVVAVLGGWHFPWPDGDWEELRDRNLLVWTLEGSEPWVEVWMSDGRTSVMQRIT